MRIAEGSEASSQPRPWARQRNTHGRSHFYRAAPPEVDPLDPYEPPLPPFPGADDGADA